MAAVETGFYQRAIDEEAYRAEMALESGERVVVGVNRYREGDDPEPAVLRGAIRRSRPGRSRGSTACAARATRAAVEAALAALRADCERAEATRCPRSSTPCAPRATLGEICGAMRAVFGEYRPA